LLAKGNVPITLLDHIIECSVILFSEPKTVSRLLLFFTILALASGSGRSLPQPKKAHHYQTPAQSAKETLSKGQKYLSYLAVAAALAVPAFITGECMMHVNFIKALYEWITHGRTARSYFSKNPTGTLYCVTVTIRDFESSPTSFFTSHTPSDLIKEVDSFLKKTIKKDKHLVRIMVEPMIATKTGKKIMLAPLYCLWDPKQGITQDLEKKFYLTATTNADNVFEALKLFTVGSLLSAQFFIIPFAYRHGRHLLTK
jgi:hypothetical protein